jgi:hypothetical protein
MACGTLLDAFDRVVVRIQNTSPREQALASDYRAHRSPQLAEDAARDLLQATYSVEGKDTDFNRIEVRSRSNEPIQRYDFFVRSTATAEKLSAQAGHER